jgi:outer membrane protein, heavy metal efflux system
MLPMIDGAAQRWVLSRFIVVVGLVLFSGCASYEKKDLVSEEFQQALADQTPENTQIIKAISQENYQPADGLGLEEAELLCLYLNPSLRKARESAGVPVASARYAGLWDDPEIGADALRILEDVDEPWIFGSSLTFTIPISGRLAVARDQAKTEAIAALVEVWTEEQQVLRELRQNWATWIEAKRSLEVTEKQLERLGEIVALVERFEELGEMIPTETNAFKLSQAGLKLEAQRLQSDEIKARLGMLGLIGVLPQAQVQFVPSEGAPLNINDIDEKMVDEKSPSIILAKARYTAAEQQLRLAVRKQYPDINLGPIYGNEDGSNRVGLGFSVPIPILNANKRGIAEADAAREAARAEWEEAVQISFADLALAKADFHAAMGRQEFLLQTVIPLAEKQVTGVRQLADIGEVNTLLLLESIEAEQDAALDLIKANADVKRAKADIQAILPSSIPEFEFPNDDDEKDEP